MKTFKKFLGKLNESIDVQRVKRKPVLQRTPREQAAIDAAKKSKPKAGKVEVYIKYEDGSSKKAVFKLTRRENMWEDEAKEIADSHLKNIQNMYSTYPDIYKDKPQPVEVHKVTIK